ncbi:tripartite tricarboxylate transporter TctB family protein [Nioella sp.]|uniref:tripartite tricarboxylate transporter TctB family protein n=1 Tax=Nioella sp. TaxID=1912091 RepID=UPI003B52FFCC
MTNSAKDVALSLSLLALSAVWTWLVIDTIPTGWGHGDIGPRAFPMVLGIILGGLCILLLIRTYVLGRTPAGKEGTVDVDAIEEASSERWGSMILVAIEISAYGFLLQKLGFLIATPILILFVLVIHLRLRSWKTILGMTLGMTLGCWLFFEKLLGIYLANGSWFNIG